MFSLYTLISKYQKFANLKLYIFKNNTIDYPLPYDKKTSERIHKDLEVLAHGSDIKAHEFIVHAVYPQCYMIVWRNFINSQNECLIFSEVLFVIETDIIQPVICCEKCNRIIDTSSFKIADHTYMQLAGQYLLYLFKYSDANISYKYSTRIIHDNHGCNSVCKDTIMSEIDMDYSASVVDQRIKATAKAISVADYDYAKKQYQYLLEYLKKPHHQLPMEKIILSQFTQIITSLTYELSHLLPHITDNLFHMLHITINEFMKKRHFNEQIIFAQDLLDTLYKMIQPNLVSTSSYTVQQMLQIIHIDYASKITLKGLASQLNIQASYLSKQFKKEVGTSFSSYLMQYRLKRAVLLMDETSYSLTNIAIAVGFDTSTYFATCFKKYYQMSPSEYKIKHIR